MLLGVRYFHIAVLANHFSGRIWQMLVSSLAHDQVMNCLAIITVSLAERRKGHGVFRKTTLEETLKFT